MIFAAGLGTRLRPLTDTMPKALVPVAGQPLLWHVLMKLKAEGFSLIVVNVHHFAAQIVGYLEQNEYFGLDVRISDESDRLLDTGGGIRHALPLFDPSSPVLIHNVDILSNARLASLYDSCVDSEADALLLVSQRKTKRYLLFDSDMVLNGWTNIETEEVKGISEPQFEASKTSFTMLAFSGIHVLSPSLFPLLADMPDRFPIIDFYLSHCHSQHFIGCEQPGLRLLDVGKIDSLHEAETFATN